MKTLNRRMALEYYKVSAGLGAGFLFVIMQGSESSYAAQPAATTAAHLLNPKGFINRGTIHIKPAASNPPPPTTITVDTTLNPMSTGSLTGTPITGQAGILYTIGTNYGVTAGTNEFFSFSTFNVGTGDTAQFMAGNNITNIISRVTGGAATNIDGTVISPASFWFVNPAGMVITGNAKFQVSGVIALGAADYVNLTNVDGSVDKYFADSTKPLVLSLGTPSSFGFLPNSQTGSFASNGWNLTEQINGINQIATVGPTPAVVIAGGSGVTLENTTLTLNEIGQGIIVPAIAPVTIGSNTGGISLINSPITAGAITLSATTGDIKLIGTALTATLNAAEIAGNVSINANNGSFDIDHASSLTSYGPSGGNIGVIATGMIAGDSAHEFAGPTIESYATNAVGDAGNISVSLGSGIGIFNGLSIATFSSLSSYGNGYRAGPGVGAGGAGNISISAGGITATSSNLLSTAVTTGEQANSAGSVSLSAVGTVTLTNSIIDSSSSGIGGCCGHGAAGYINVFAGDSIALQSTILATTLDGTGLPLVLPAPQSPPLPAPGSINLRASGNLSVTNSELNSASTFPSGNAGGITISAGGALSISGGPNSNYPFMGTLPPIFTQVGITNIVPSTYTISSNVSNNGGNAGPIAVISQGAISISDASINSTTTGGAGNAGTVTIQSTGSTVTLNNTTVSTLSEGGGDAGSISIFGLGVLVENQSIINADYNNAGGNNGSPGSILIQADGSDTNSAPQTVLNEATAGVVTLAGSTITSTNTGGLGGIGGEILIGAAPPATYELPAISNSLSSTDAVVISGSTVSNSVSAGGQGSPLIINGTRGLWISGASSILSTTDATAASPGQIYILGGSSGINIAQSTVNANNGYTAMGNGPPNTTMANIQITSTGGPVNLTSSTITATTTGIDAGGNIALKGQTISIDGGSISASSNPISDLADLNAVYPGGDAGTISITSSGADPSSTVASLRIYGGATISSSACSLPPCTTAGVEAGNAGSITLAAYGGSVQIGLPTDSLSSPNVISTSAGLTAGQAGTTSIVGQNIWLTDSQLLTTVATGNLSDANSVSYVPAFVMLNAAGALQLTNSLIDTRTTGAVDAGFISLSGGSVNISGGQQPAALVLPATYFGNPSPVPNVAAFSATTGMGNAGEIDVYAPNGGVTIAGSPQSPTGLFATTYGIGMAGLISIRANSVTAGVQSPSGYSNANAANDVLIESQTQAFGAGGDVELTATSGAINLYGTTINAESVPPGPSGPSANTFSIPGSAGNIIIDGYTVGVFGAALSTKSNGPGRAGEVKVTATGGDLGNTAALTVASGSDLSSDALGGTAFLSGTGAGGVLLNATTGSVALGLSTDKTTTTVSSSSGTFSGPAGQVLVTAGERIALNSVDLSTTGGSLVTSPSTFYLPVGDITLLVNNNPLTPTTGTGPITISNSLLNASTTGVQKGGDITITGSQVIINNESQILAATKEVANAGTIAINADGADTASGPTGAALQVTGGSTLLSDASAGQSIRLGFDTYQTANAGSVTLSAANGSVEVGLGSDAAPTVLSTVAGSNTNTAVGAAGTVSISGNSITLDQAQLLTTAFGATPAAASGAKSKISLVTNDNGAAGAVTVKDSTLNASTSGTQTGGDISLTGSQIVITSKTSILAATTGPASAGDITINANNGNTGSSPSQAALQVTGGSTISSDASNPDANIAVGDAGTVKLTASNAQGSIQIGLAGENQSTISSSSGPSAGSAGNIAVIAGYGINFWRCDS